MISKIKENSAAAIASTERTAGATTDWVLIDISGLEGGQWTLCTILHAGSRSACARFADRIPADVAPDLAIVPREVWENLEHLVGGEPNTP